MKIKKLSPSLIGLAQAIGVFVYCLLISLFFKFMESASIEPPQLFGIMVMLALLVVSAAITGLLVFGIPVYFVINKEVKKALIILGYTFLYILLVILIIISIIIF